MNPIISVIVPVYNVEKYLARCIESIIHQTFADFEVILVDDGSTDNSLSICNEYSKKDSRFRVIHKENGGLSDARNAGLDIAQGKYVSFIDSDDLIHPQMLSLLYDALVKHSADVAVCNYVQFSDHIPESMICLEDPSFESRSTDKILSTFFKDSQWWVGASVCNKLFATRIFENLRFPVRYIYEDSFVQTDILTRAERVIKINANLYFYYQRNGSIMKSKYSEKCFVSGMAFAKHNLDFFENQTYIDQSEKAYEAYAEQYIKQKLAIYQSKINISTTAEDKYFRSRINHLLASHQICKMKKLVMILLFISPKIALQLCRKYFPECLYDFMR